MRYLCRALATAPPQAARREFGRAAIAWAALRPGEWIKNLLVFAPLLFSGRADEGAALAKSGLVFAAFCAMASAGYLFNDLRDAELDRRHPVKSARPIASGQLGEGLAAGLAAALAAAGLALAAPVGWRALGVVAAYGALTAAYTLYLKQLVIIDVMTIAGCFVARVLGGAVAIDVTASRWLIVCTGMLALFLGFTKRRQEATSEEHFAPDSRPVLEHYSLPFLDQMVSLVTGATLISYVIYATGSPLVGDRMLVTVPCVAYGMFRYLYLIYERRDTRSTPILLTRDPGLIGAMAARVAVALLAIYL